jgi:hypothetical protein
MSARNGDKARFGRLRKQRILLRKRIREIRAALALALAEKPSAGLRIPKEFA